MWAETRFVTNPLDAGPGSLRAAIDSAVSGDTIQFHLQLPTQINLETPLFVSGKSITIYGPGIPNLHISGNQSVPVFVNHGDLTIYGVKIRTATACLAAVYSTAPARSRFLIPGYTAAGASWVAAFSTSASST